MNCLTFTWINWVKKKKAERQETKKVLTAKKTEAY